MVPSGSLEWGLSHLRRWRVTSVMMASIRISHGSQFSAPAMK